MSDERITDAVEVKEFINKYAEKSPAELSAIITRYIGYKPEAVDAALYLSVEKGLISYDLKEMLWKQIEASFKAHGKNIKYSRWESSNAFISYFSGYSDEDIYNIIENPDKMVIDVFHALLVTAKNRELISDIDFDRYYSEAKEALNADERINISILSEVFGLNDNNNYNDYTDETPVAEKLEKERAKYWKCDKCGENVGMEYAVCWNCQASIPEVIEHPDSIEILKEAPPKWSASPLKIGLRLIGTGIFVFLIDMFRHYRYSSYLLTHLGGYIISGLLTAIGIGFIVYGAFFEKDKE